MGTDDERLRTAALAARRGDQERERATDILPERDLPGLIRRYNESVGGVNSDSEGYHETITQVFIRTLRRALAGGEGEALHKRVNAVLLAPEGRRDWPLRFYSPERLFSKAARLGWVKPDLAALTHD
jgi:hypothetical protein